MLDSVHSFESVEVSKWTLKSAKLILDAQNPGMS